MKSLNKTKTKKSKIIIQKPITKVLLVLVVSLILLSGILTLTPKRETKEMFSAIQGALQEELVPSVSDLFNCGGRDDCADDVDKVNYPEPQHKYIAQAFDKFGFPLAGVKYKWTQDDAGDLIKFREDEICKSIATQPECDARDSCAWNVSCFAVVVDETAVIGGESSQEIYVQPNEDSLQNGGATVNVLAYLDDETQGKDQSIDVTLYFCLNTWPSTVTFPFSDDTDPRSDPYTNFETYYCKDRGSITNPGDDYAALKVIERASAEYDFLCSGGGGNGLKCDKDYFIEYNGSWSKDSLNSYLGGIPAKIFSPDAVAMTGNRIIFFDGNEWAYFNGAIWSDGNLETAQPIAGWPNGPTPGVLLKPTAIGWHVNHILLIEDDSFTESTDGGTSWSVLSTLSEDSWPTDMQFPDEVALWNPSGIEYRLTMKDNYYRIYHEGNFCNGDSKCETPGGRVWGSCTIGEDDTCYWGERFSLYDARDWPTSISGWKDNIRFPFKTIGLDRDRATITSSCEYSGGICLLKEFLLISSPACSDGIDNDDDGAVDLADADCTGPDDNSESGTCDDGIDNDNDGTVDYPDDFSCNSYSDIEEEQCDEDGDGNADAQCCDNEDNDNDGLVDQHDGGCSEKYDIFEINACADGADNDGDDLIDLADPGCTDATDDDERGVMQCDDGEDNDGDGASDYPADFGCDGPGDDQEINNGINQCNNGVDDDGDGDIDQDDDNCDNWEDTDESS